MPDTELKYVGSIYVQGIFGDAIKAHITPMIMRRCNDDADISGITSLGDETQIICALLDDLATGHGLILPIDMANELTTQLFVMPSVNFVCDFIFVFVVVFVNEIVS